MHNTCAPIVAKIAGTIQNSWLLLATERSKSWREIACCYGGKGCKTWNQPTTDTQKESADGQLSALWCTVYASWRAAATTNTFGYTWCQRHHVPPLEGGQLPGVGWACRVSERPWSQQCLGRRTRLLRPCVKANTQVLPTPAQTHQ